jgi:hypothetical protein
MAIVEAVRERGYLDGYTEDQLAARQVVKLLEEVCEALQAVNADDVDLHLLIQQGASLGKWARAVFDVPSLFADVTVDFGALGAEFVDLVVPTAVLGDVLEIPDMMAAGYRKAQADVARGVREGKTQRFYEEWIKEQPLSSDAVADVARGVRNGQGAQGV